MSELGPLIDSLVGEDEWTRHQALDRLRSGGASADLVRELVGALGGDDSSQRAAARMALAALASPESAGRTGSGEALRQGLLSPDPDLRVLAASAMGESGNGAFAAPLIAALQDPDPNVVAAAADALGELGPPAALEPLSGLTARPEFWVRAAAVVALGRFRDPRTIPAVEAAGRMPGLEAAMVEALRRIDDPAALPVLEGLYRARPADALAAAGAILSSHPAAETPRWVVEGARSRERELLERVAEEDDPVAARLVGLAGTPTGVERLVTLAAPPHRSEAALNGLMASPPALRVGPILDRVPDADPDVLVALLAVLPPLRDPEAIDRLVPLLSHPESRVRAGAAEALARSEPGYSFRRLAAELDRPGVAPEVIRAAGALGSTACAALLPLLHDSDAGVRAAVADALGRCADSAIGRDLAAALDREPEPRARRAILGALGRAATGDAVPLLRGALDDPDPEARIAVIEALGATGSADAIADLTGLLDGPRHERLAAIRALGEIGVPDAFRPVEPYLGHPDLDTRRAAARAVFPVARALDRSAVESLATDADAWLRSWAARMLAEHGEAGRPVLERLAEEDPDPAVRGEARRALERKG